MTRLASRQLGGDLRHVAPLKRAPASSLSLGWREPSPAAMVEAPYGDPPVTSLTPI
jgi:hypothetical protein